MTTAIAEPVTTLTDYALALTALGAAAWVERRRSDDHGALRLWAIAFGLTGLAATLGGTTHALRPRLSTFAFACLWIPTYAAVAAADFAILAGVMRGALPARFRPIALVALGVRFLVAVVWIAVRQTMGPVVVDYGTTLLALACLGVARMGGGGAGGASLLSGTALALAGAVVQRTGQGPHPAFNHNDLFHVLQAIAIVLWARAAPALAEPHTADGP